MAYICGYINLTIRHVHYCELRTAAEARRECVARTGNKARWVVAVPAHVQPGSHAYASFVETMSAVSDWSYVEAPVLDVSVLGRACAVDAWERACTAWEAGSHVDVRGVESSRGGE